MQVKNMKKGAIISSTAFRKGFRTNGDAFVMIGRRSHVEASDTVGDRGRKANRYMVIDATHRPSGACIVNASRLVKGRPRGDKIRIMIKPSALDRLSCVTDPSVIRFHWIETAYRWVLRMKLGIGYFDLYYPPKTST